MLKMLMVDDDPDVIADWQSQAADEPRVEVDYADSLDGAQQALSGQAYDVVVCDGYLPECEGKTPHHEMGMAVLHRARVLGIKTRVACSSMNHYNQEVLDKGLATHAADKHPAFALAVAAACSVGPK